MKKFIKKVFESKINEEINWLEYDINAEEKNIYDLYSFKIFNKTHEFNVELYDSTITYPKKIIIDKLEMFVGLQDVKVDGKKYLDNIIKEINSVMEDMFTNFHSVKIFELHIDFMLDDINDDNFRNELMLLAKGINSHTFSRALNYFDVRKFDSEINEQALTFKMK